MNYVDSHTHLYLGEEFGEESQMVVRRAIETGVTKMVFPNVDLSPIEPMMQLHSAFADNTYIALGLHPTEVKSDWQEVLEQISPMLETHRPVAVGEIGIDMYWDKTYREEQMQALDIQLRWAEVLSLPVILHCRDGLNEVLEVLDAYRGEVPQIVFHSFTGSVEDVEKIRKRGDFYFGINGVVTFKNAQSIREALPVIGLDRIMLETDAPYLAPVPHRGKRNESSYIPLIAMKVGEVLGVDVAEVASKTTENASRFFGI